jgi:antitoxin CptB
MTTEQDLNRLRWRCRRGMRELDALLMRFLDRGFPAAGVARQAAFRRLLDMPDPEILDLLTGRLCAKDADLSHVIERIRRADRDSHG